MPDALFYICLTGTNSNPSLNGKNDFTDIHRIRHNYAALKNSKLGRASPWGQIETGHMVLMLSGRIN
jgi:hypothetical protein